MGDQLWMSRYILHRVCEDFNVLCSFDPKPMSDWNSFSAYCSFSTLAMRKDGGITAINAAVKKLTSKHAQHVSWYKPRAGKDDKCHLTDRHKTKDIKTFSSETGQHGASIRIPHQVTKDGKGYLEEKLPVNNCDPYQVMEALVRTIVLDD